MTEKERQEKEVEKESPPDKLTEVSKKPSEMPSGTSGKKKDGQKSRRRFTIRGS